MGGGGGGGGGESPGKLHYTLFAGLTQIPNGVIQAAHNVVGGGSLALSSDYEAIAESATFSPAATLVRLVAEVDTYVAIDTNPNPTDNAARFLMPAGSVDYIALSPGLKLAAIDKVTADDNEE